LRERSQEIPLLCRFFVEKYAAKYESSVQQLPADLVEAFVRYEWPGNIRELENAVRRFLILPDLAATLKVLRPPRVEVPVTQEKLALKKVSTEAAEQVEKEMILRTLSQTNWNRKRAAQELGICYKALLNKLKKWNLNERALTASSGSLI
jgi:two-component system response regulator AtoC